jgi:hypothetical protein
VCPIAKTVTTVKHKDAPAVALRIAATAQALRWDNYRPQAIKWLNM